MATVVIDCDAPPSVPDGWGVDAHIPGGHLEFRPENVGFYVSERQRSRTIEGYSLLNELVDELGVRRILNANVLDHLLRNPQLIPEAWKEAARHICFWGTIYRWGAPCIRYLYWNGFTKAWEDSAYHVGDNFYVNDVAAVLQEAA